MLLSALCIIPLVINLDKKLQGPQLGSRGARTTALAYTDDITIIATRSEDTDIIKENLHDYEKATGARNSTQKSRAIALRSWDKLTPITDIEYRDEIKILGEKYKGIGE